tara:strand:- start:10264 stop:11181 length:918 start_codon:yes stop_codon:yes gene_type:complete
MKKAPLFLAIITIFSISLVIAGVPNFQAVDVLSSKGHATITIPSKAVEVAPGIFSLGTTVDIDGKIVEGYAIIDKKENHAKGTCNNNNICEPNLGEKNSCADCRGGDSGTESSCYAFLAKDAKWNVVEPYLVDASNNAGLNEGTVKTILADAIAEWETESGTDILGNENLVGIVDRESIVGSDGIYNNYDPVLNGKNEVIFADISGTGTIGVTIVWGIFSGRPRDRELREWDQVYDDTTFDWSFTGASGTMDFENIAQHELGHSIGLGHPDSSCTEETMYASTSLGEIIKRDLFDGDKTGIKRLY